MLQLQEVEKPTTKPNEVLIRIVATAVVKEDPDMRRSPGFNGFLKPRHPILGMELAGEVESVGKKVTRFKSGDPIFVSIFAVNYDGYAEYKCLPENGVLVLKPVR